MTLRVRFDERIIKYMRRLDDWRMNIVLFEGIICFKYVW